jgi:hypothetical protein
VLSGFFTQYSSLSTHRFVLSLPLLVLGVLADDADDALPPHDLALRTNLFDR